jgi:hypothetical protein
MTNEMLVDAPEPGATPGISAREELAGCLDEYRKLSEELAGYEKAHAQSEEDEACLLADHQSDEEALVEKLARVAAKRMVFERRLAARQSDLTAARAKLETVLTAASGQLRGEYLAVLEARRRELAEAVLRVLEIPATPILPPGIGQAVGNSPRIRAIEECRPVDANAVGHLPIEQRASDVLSKFERLEGERSI